MEAIAKGILSGLGYGLLLGPLFFLNIRITLSQGSRHGMALVAGAFVSDLSLVLASWWGATQLASITNDHVFQTWFGIICAVMLLAFGISAAWPRKRDIEKELQAAVTPTKRRYTFLQGLLINFSNPSNWLFWLSVATVAKSQATAEAPHYAEQFMIAALLTLFSTDLIKVLLAHRIGRWLRPEVVGRVIQVAGGILIVLSIWLLVKTCSGIS